MLELVRKPPKLDHANEVVASLLQEMLTTTDCAEHARTIRRKLEELRPHVRAGNVEEVHAYYFVFAIGVERAIDMQDPSVASYLAQVAAEDIGQIRRLIERKGHLVKLSERETLTELAGCCKEQVGRLEVCFAGTS